METEIFAKALNFTLQWEGGFVHHPLDPGGPTNKGVTQKVYDDWRLRQGLPMRPVVAITDSELRAIYLEFWRASKATEFEGPYPRTAVTLFDTAVQFGTLGGVQLLQRALGRLVVDGLWGPKTQARVEEELYKYGDLVVAIKISSERILYRGERVAQNKAQLAFLRGWLARDTALIRLISSWPG
jgi:lysozyme family protein